MKDVISAFLLDTPIIVLPYLGQPLPKRTREILADPATERLISPASIMELAIKGEELKMSEENLRTYGKPSAICAWISFPLRRSRLTASSRCRCTIVTRLTAC